MTGKKIHVVGIDTNRDGETVWRCDGGSAFEGSLWQEGTLVRCVEGEFEGCVGIKVENEIYIVKVRGTTGLTVR